MNFLELKAHDLEKFSDTLMCVYKVKVHVWIIYCLGNVVIITVLAELNVAAAAFYKLFLKGIVYLYIWAEAHFILI